MFKTPILHVDMLFPFFPYSIIINKTIAAFISEMFRNCKIEKGNFKWKLFEYEGSGSLYEKMELYLD